jgi:hypothetical protein
MLKRNNWLTNWTSLRKQDRDIGYREGKRWRNREDIAVDFDKSR